MLAECVESAVRQKVQSAGKVEKNGKNERRERRERQGDEETRETERRETRRETRDGRRETRDERQENINSDRHWDDCSEWNETKERLCQTCQTCQNREQEQAVRERVGGRSWQAWRDRGSFYGEVGGRASTLLYSWRYPQTENQIDRACVLPALGQRSAGGIPGRDWLAFDVLCLLHQAAAASKARVHPDDGSVSRGEGTLRDASISKATTSDLRSSRFFYFILFYFLLFWRCAERCAGRLTKKATICHLLCRIAKMASPRLPQENAPPSHFRAVPQKA